MPMTASRYGAIPITTLNGGLADNFNDENAIIVYDDLNEAIY
jgi:glycogen synthase